jgi:hypothetical protein
MKAREIFEGSLPVFRAINIEFPSIHSFKSHRIPKENFHSCSTKMHPIGNPAQCLPAEQYPFPNFSPHRVPMKITEPYICQNVYITLSYRVYRPQCGSNEVVKSPTQDANIGSWRERCRYLARDVPNQKVSKRHMLKIQRSQLI